MDMKKMQQKYYELQILDQQMRQIQAQIQKLDQQSVDIQMTIQAVSEIKSVKTGSEILVPLSQGIYIKAEIKENNNLILNVGSNVATEKNVADTKALLDEQLNEISIYRDEMLVQLQNFAREAHNIEIELEAMNQDVPVSKE